MQPLTVSLPVLPRRTYLPRQAAGGVAGADRREQMHRSVAAQGQEHVFVRHVPI